MELKEICVDVESEGDMIVKKRNDVINVKSYRWLLTVSLTLIIFTTILYCRTEHGLTSRPNKGPSAFHRTVVMKATKTNVDKADLQVRQVRMMQRAQQQKLSQARRAKRNIEGGRLDKADGVSQQSNDADTTQTDHSAVKKRHSEVGKEEVKTL